MLHGGVGDEPGQQSRFAIRRPWMRETYVNANLVIVLCVRRNFPS